jgi:tetratricopeptide (TPR) repeat protein
MSRKILVILCCCLLLSSCTVYQQVVTVVSEQAKEEPDTDLSCSYFYFLWGSHAEFGGRYAEALEAYEKALICDPKVNYLKERIPILLLKMGEYEKAATSLRQALIDRPEENNNRLFLAGLYIQQEKFEEAIKLYYEILKTDSDNENVYLNLGLLYSHQEEYDKAENIFRQLLKKNGESYFARLALARLLKQTGKHQEAIDHYEKALMLNWSKELAFEIGNYFSSLKEYINALHIYTSITENDPFDEKAGLSRVQTFLDMGKNDEALEELKNISSFSKDPTTIEIIISKVLLRKNEPQKAKDILERLVRESNNSESRYLLALLAYQEEKLPAAISHLDHISPTSTNFEESVFLQIRIYKESGQEDKGVALLRKHIAKLSTRRPLFYALLAAFYHEKNQDLAAISLLETAVTLYPENPQLFFDYGLMLDKNGMEQQALNKMLKVLELQPDHAEALNFVGYTWADKNIRLQEALEYIKKAIALKPDNGYIVDSLGWIYYRLGDYQRAVQELNRSLELEPEDPHIHDHLGDVYRSLDKKNEALEQYGKALKLFEDEKKKNAIREKINALEKQQ